MAKLSLRLTLLRDRRFRDIVSYLDELRRTHSDVDICRALFEAYIQQEFIGRPNIFALFLTWSSSLDTIALFIHHGPSLFVRKQGIRQFGKALADPKRWESAWDILGGTEGLIDHFAEVSVIEVKYFTKVIGNCNHGQRATTREKAIEGLLRALLPSHYPDSKVQSRDNRPISRHYARMVTACSPEFVEQLLDEKDESNPLYRQVPARRLIKTHGELLQKRIFDSLAGDGYRDNRIDRFLGYLVYREPSRCSPDPRVSASMAFATKVLQLRISDADTDKRWHPQISEVDIFLSIFNRSCRRLPKTELRDVMKLGLKLLEAEPKLLPTFRLRRVWFKLIALWRRVPELYEDEISMALRLGLGGSHKTIAQDFLETSNTLGPSPELRWSLLKQYCLHVPKEGVDLDTSEDFSPFANQLWSSEVFYQVSKDKAIRLLNGLLRANPSYRFLQPSDTSGKTVLSSKDLVSQHNFNAVLLLTILQKDSVEIQKRAEICIDELRRQSAAAKDPSDRAAYATAASAYAIASGNLDLYGETVLWQQRYVRDPLTVKAIFSWRAVKTSEGIELLSGIPQISADDVTWADVASKVQKANGILKTFHDILCQAKREPSFHPIDWDGVESLFGAVISHRVALVKEHGNRGQGPDEDVYASIWRCTLDMLGELSTEIRDESVGAFQPLFVDVPPTVLASIAKVMLDVGSKKRENQDRQSGDDVLERLSYAALFRLAASGMPELARPLVQTILERPDASSWHRQFMSISFMNRLNAQDARQTVLAFATSIGEKLEEQSYVKVGEELPSKSAQPASLVKVTTVKYLAQLLDNAEFISADSAIEVLVDIFKVATHRDILLATLESLLSLLTELSSTSVNWRSNPSVETIMAGLDTIIRVVGSVNERRPLRQEDWEEAIKTGELPEISDMSDGVPPLFGAMICAADIREHPARKNLREEFVARFLIPALRHSQAEHGKWVALFLAKHNGNLTVNDLPQMPINPTVWSMLIGSYPELIPQGVMEDFNEYIVMTISPPVALTDFNKRLKEDADLCRTSEVRHWLAVFGKGMDSYGYSGTQTLLGLIHHSRPIPSIGNGITFDSVFDIVTAHALLFLHGYESRREVWTKFVNDLRPPSNTTYPYNDADSIRSMTLTWQETGRLVLEKVAALVLDAKAGDNRSSVLPSATKLLLWLLPYPCFPDAANVDQECKAFVKKLVELLDSFLTSETDMIRWPKLADDAFTVCELLNSASERLHVAFYVGDLVESSPGHGDVRSSVLNFVRITLAMRLIEHRREVLVNGIKNKDPSSQHLARRLKQRIEQWQRSSDEDIREQVAEWRYKQTALWGSLMSSD